MDKVQQERVIRLFLAGVPIGILAEQESFPSRNKLSLAIKEGLGVPELPKMKKEERFKSLFLCCIGQDALWAHENSEILQRAIGMDFIGFERKIDEIWYSFMNSTPDPFAGVYRLVSVISRGHSCWHLVSAWEGAILDGSIQCPESAEDAWNSALKFVAESFGRALEPFIAGKGEELVREFENRLTPREFRVLGARFGLDGKGVKNLKEVAQILGPEIVKERVRQTEAKAMRKIRPQWREIVAKYWPGSSQWP